MYISFCDSYQPNIYLKPDLVLLVPVEALGYLRNLEHSVTVTPFVVWMTQGPKLKSIQAFSIIYSVCDVVF